MASIVGATFINNEIEPGWEIAGEGVLLGKRYRIDLGRVLHADIANLTLGRTKRIEWVWIVEPGPPGWFPLCALKVDES